MKRRCRLTSGRPSTALAVLTAGERLRLDARIRGNADTASGLWRAFGESHGISFRTFCWNIAQRRAELGLPAGRRGRPGSANTQSALAATKLLSYLETTGSHDFVGSVIAHMQSLHGGGAA